MNSKIFLILIALIILDISCSQKRNSTPYNKIISFQTDTVVITISPSELPTYYKFTNYSDKKNNNQFFVGYNEFEHSFDYFDVGNKTLLKKVYLEHEGPNGVRTVNEFSFVKDDTIVIRGNPFYYKIDTNGTVITRKSFLDLQNGNDFLFMNMMELVYPENSIAYNNGKFYSYILPVKFMFWQNEFYEKPIIASVELENNSVNPLPVYYPEEASPNRLFGYLLKPYIFNMNNFLIYNFPFSSKVYWFNLITQKTDVFDIPSELTKNESDPLEYSSFNGNRESFEIDRHFLNALHFHKIIYDPFNNLFYRIHTLVPDVDDKYKKNLNYLCVFDETFNKIGEIEINSNLFINNYLPTKNGILFQITNHDNIKDMNKLKFIRLNLIFSSNHMKKNRLCLNNET